MLKKDAQHLVHVLRENADLKIGVDELRFLRGSGLNHDHVVLGDTGWLARVPRGNSPLTGDEYLARQDAVYRAAMPSRHTPALLTSISPRDELPHGALIVQRIDAVRKADFGKDYRSIATALASIHKTPPPTSAVPAAPGASQREYLDAMLVPALKSGRLNAGTHLLLANALEHCGQDLARMARLPALPTGFVASDTHPANFLIDRKGKAWMVDLEYATSDCPLVDTAIAACPLTRRFNPASRPTVPVGTSHKFFRAWMNDYAQGRPDSLRQTLAEARPAMQRVAMLGSLGWLAFWQTDGRATMAGVPHGTAGTGMPWPETT